MAPNAATKDGRGFTLIELVVTLAIISILGSLSLAALAGARQRGKIDKTKSTIRKLHEIILPQHESYISRRTITSALPNPSRQQCPHCYLPGDDDGTPTLTAKVTAWRRLIGRRSLAAQEMPDQWTDVVSIASSVSKGPISRRYQAYSNNVSPIPAPGIYSSAECLFMVVTRGGFSPDATEAFRSDEVGDINSNKAPEFVDGWGRPIAFVRWPAGYESPLQPFDATTNPDPLDPFGVSGSTSGTPDYNTIPLILSAGPDESLNDPNGAGNGYGIQTSSAWLTADYLTLLSTTRQGSPLIGSRADASACKDNITNHDFLKK